LIETSNNIKKIHKVHKTCPKHKSTGPVLKLVTQVNDRKRRSTKQFW